MKASTVKLAVDCLDSYYDITLNTDCSYASVRSKDKLMSRNRHRIEQLGYGQYEKIVDAYLELLSLWDEIKNQPEDRRFTHFPIDLKYKEEIEP